MEVVIYIVVFLYGIVIGSFLNVCIYRIPKEENIVKVRSHCMSCNYQLRWFDLIPLFSWLAFRGKCRKCGEKISIQYPLVEAANGVLYLCIFYIHGFDSVATLLTSVLYCLMASALLALSIIDLRTYEIPFGFNVFIFVLGLLHIGIDYRNWLTYIIGMAAVSVILELLLLVSGGRAIGGGDVKLMASAGLLLGWQKIIVAFFLGCIIAAVIHPIRMKVSSAERVLAMGPYLSIGILLLALWGDTWINGYLQWAGLI